jgi:hypothetical protein
MHKQLTFVITAAILLTAFTTVALYTVNAAHAQGNATGAGGNMTKNATAGAANMTKNATGAVAGAMKNATD